MCSCLGHSRGATVVAGIAGASTHRIGRQVGVLHTQPIAGGLVAALTNCHASMRAGIGLRRQTIGSSGMAAGTTCGHCHTGMELGRQPSDKPSFVACNAVRCGWNMAGVLTRRS